MADLSQHRNRVDEIDKQIVALFEERMKVVVEIAKYKLENDLPIFHKDREQQVIEKNLARLQNKELEKYTAQFIQNLMDVSKEYQCEQIGLCESTMPVTNGEKHRNSKDIKLGFPGTEGSFSEQALLEYFGEGFETSNYKEFEDVFKAIENKTIDYGVLPMENSSTGAISQVYDLIRNYGFYIVGEHRVNISQNILGIKGSKLEDLKELYSHPQGFEQSSEFLKTIKHCEFTPFYNTAISAKMVKELGDKTKGAIASKRAADIYDLDIIKADINNAKDNVTRFVVVGRELESSPESDKLTVVFSLGNKAGQLYDLLRYFAENNINMIKIESRPMGDSSFSHFLYIDFEGNIEKPEVRKALKLLEENSLNFKLLGAYRAWDK